MPHFQKHINILVMPTDSCNLNCVYCFHKPHQKDYDIMSIATVKKMLDITAPYYNRINIIWHGGEPLLMGLEFYQKVVELEKKYPIEIRNSIQSNLTLLSDEMADFFAKNDFSVSGSFDGTCNMQSRGHNDEILAARQLMIDRGKRCGLIMVVSNLNINNLVESYHIFKKLDVNFSLNLYLDQKDNEKEQLKLDEYLATEKLKELFDYWAYDQSGNIHISYFKHILDYILFKRKSLCTFTSCMGRWIGVRHNGDIGPCNRYFPDEYKYGNVFDYTDIGDAFDSKGFGILLKQAITRREKCKECEIFDFCCGGCNNNALNENGIESNKGVSCRILLSVYNYIFEFLEKISSNSIDLGLNPLLVQMLDEINVT